MAISTYRKVSIRWMGSLYRPKVRTKAGGARALTNSTTSASVQSTWLGLEVGVRDQGQGQGWVRA